MERNADPADGRAGVLALTAAGRAALADALAWYGDVIGRALAGWTRDEVAALGAALRRFTADVGRTLGHPDPLEAAR